MKGISLPINAVIIVALAAIVLLVVGSFFMTGTGPSMSKIQARQVFEDRCPKLKCEFTDSKNVGNDKDFMHACETLYGKGINGAQCLWYCECGLEVDTCKLNCNICKADAKEKASCIALLKNKYPNCACS